MCLSCPNTTSLVQPPDQGILDAIKGNIERKLCMKPQTKKVNRNRWLRLKNAMIKDAIQWSAEFWDHITLHSLRSSWNKILSCAINEPKISEQAPISSEDLDEGAIVAPWILES